MIFDGVFCGVIGLKMAQFDDLGLHAKFMLNSRFISDSESSDFERLELWLLGGVGLSVRISREYCNIALNLGWVSPLLIW